MRCSESLTPFYSQKYIEFSNSQPNRYEDTISCGSCFVFREQQKKRTGTRLNQLLGAEFSIRSQIKHPLGPTLPIFQMPIEGNLLFPTLTNIFIFSDKIFIEMIEQVRSFNIYL